MDNREGPLPLFEEAPIHPLEIDGGELWAANVPGASVSVFDLADPLRPRLSAEIPVGLGPVTVRRRPGSSGEVWVVCQSSNSVFILDARGRRVVDTVRVAAEPSGLVFDASGETAYVTLSATSRIARIEASTRRVLAPLEFASEVPGPDGGSVPARVPEPRALLLDGSDLFVLSYQSGNGTAADVLDSDQDRAPFEIVDAWSLPGPPPPDRDVLRFGLPDTKGQAALWRMGTLNFDLVRGAGGEVWVSNVDHQNAHFSKMGPAGEAFAFHRVSRARPSATGGPQGGTVHLDLNVHRDPRLPADLRCAMPTDLALSADGSRLYVACYETRTTVVVDTRAGRVVHALRANAADTAGGFGPRGLALNEPAGAVYVYNRGDNTVQVFRMPSGEASVAEPVGPALSAGFDPTPAAVKAGRLHFIDARNSASGLVSCNTCHADGQSDGLAWDLRDFTGDLPRDAEPRDADNVIKATMDLRGIEATPPYHWRGDRADLAAFNSNFELLLGGRRLPRAKVREMEAYVFALALPPNPRQDERRALTPRALAGFGCFTSREASHQVSTDTSGFPTSGGKPEGQLAVTCRDCHSMEGGLATNNQIINEVRFPVPSATAQLQGLFDKRRDTAFYAGAVRPVGGWGFGNHGSFATVDEFIGMFPHLTAPQKELLDAFLGELDTGMAPAAAYAWTLHAGQPDQPLRDYLIPQADAGHIDLVARAWIDGRATGFLFDPRRRVFRSDTSEELSYERLAAAAPTLTFLGVPVGSGWRLGIDRDLDFLPDGEEAAHGASTSSADSDGDGFPDGYEVRHGSRPDAPSSRPGREGVAPAIRNAEVAWVSSTVAKVRWETEEEAVSRVRVVPAGAPPEAAVWSAELGRPARRQAAIVRGLRPGERYEVLVEAEDLARPPNRAETRLAVRTQLPLFRNVHLAGTSVSRQTDPATRQEMLLAEFEVADELDRPVEGAVVHFKVVEWAPGKGANAVRYFSSPPTRGGKTLLAVPVSLKGGTAEVLVDRRFEKGVEDRRDRRLYFHPLDGELRYWARAEPH